jgi:hypothetical protein
LQVTLAVGGVFGLAMYRALSGGDPRGGQLTSTVETDGSTTLENVGASTPHAACMPHAIPHNLPQSEQLGFGNRSMTKQKQDWFVECVPGARADALAAWGWCSNCAQLRKTETLTRVGLARADKRTTDIESAVSPLADAEVAGAGKGWFQRGEQEGG